MGALQRRVVRPIAAFDTARAARCLDGPRAVEMPLALPDQPMHASFAEHQEVVKTLLAQTAQEPLAHRVRLESQIQRPQYFDP